MAGTFSTLDWIVVICYLALLLTMGWFFKSFKSSNSKDYFLAGNQMPSWVVAFSVLATTQSAATFLGGPDQGYRGNFTYLTSFIGALIAALIVAKILVPIFYKNKVTTVYEILFLRVGRSAMLASSFMYLVGRFLASGARLYLAAIAVSMILYSNIDAKNIIVASLVLTMLGFFVTFIGGIRSVIWSDLLQFIVYTVSALAVLYYLYNAIPANFSDIIKGLENSPHGQNKLMLFNFNLNFSDPYTVISIFTGFTLLYIGNFGLDQDTTQRLLTCENEKQGGRAIILSVLISIPLIWVFISIGQLLHIYYNRPELMDGATDALINNEFNGEQITVFMHYILSELPSGLKGLVAVGVIAAAVSTINSGLNSMSSVIVEDYYRPWREKRGPVIEKHFVRVGQISMASVGIILFLMSVLCFYWQRYSGLPLLDFALSVMVFAYSGLLGVYFTIVFTNRGSSRSVIMALATGFFVTLLLQSYIIDILNLPAQLKEITFTWQLCIGSLSAFIVCFIGQTNKTSLKVS